MQIDMAELILGKTRRLAHIRRYSSTPVIRPENVAEHSFYCALYAYGLALARAAGPSGEGGEYINGATVLRRALLHDLSEAISGDIIRTYKYSSPDIQAAMMRADYLNMQKLAEEIAPESAAADYLLFSWDDAKDETIEGECVRIADVLCVVGYCVEEVLSGNRHLLPVMEEAIEGVLKPIVSGTPWEPIVAPIIARARKEVS